MSLLPGGSKAAARYGVACLRPTVVSVKTAKEDTMTTTLLDYRAMMVELHVDELLREAAAARKVQAARAARRQRGV
jgi:PHD/YefM family antitoxin component YafN of YafNO toxin-antitoxin module